jgi:hypothetical protein
VLAYLLEKYVIKIWRAFKKLRIAHLFPLLYSLLVRWCAVFPQPCVSREYFKTHFKASFLISQNVQVSESKKVIPTDLTFMYEVCGSDVTIQHTSLLFEVANFNEVRLGS